MRKPIMAGALVVAFGLGAAASPTLSAVEKSGRISAQERQLLNNLSPEVRRDVMSRMTGGQTVEGILETMVLNRLSSMAAGGQVVDVDVYHGIATIVDANGQRQTVPFTVEQIVVGPAEGGGQMQQKQGWGVSGQPQERTGTRTSSPYPQGSGVDRGDLGRTSEGNVGPRERGLGEKPAP